MSTLPPRIFSRRFCSVRAASGLEMAPNWIAHPAAPVVGVAVGVETGAGLGAGAAVVVAIGLRSAPDLVEVSRAITAGVGRHGLASRSARSSAGEGRAERRVEVKIANTVMVEDNLRSRAEKP